MSPATAEAPTRAAHYTEIAIGEIAESPSNPRKRFGELEELAANIQQHGIIEPLVVRPHPIQMDGYELVCGARRLRAAALAGLVDVPCLVRTLTDREVLELQISENLARKDVHPLEEADSYDALMRADGAYTVEAVAARVGRSTSYVYQRLRLLNLVDDARAAFDTEEITAAHAVRLARLSAADQDKALDECFYQLFGDRQGQREVRPVAHLEDWIRDHTKVDVTDRDAVQHYLPELHQQLADEPEPEKLLALSTSLMPAHYLGTKDHGLLGQGRWKSVKSEKACPNTQRGVIVHGAANVVLWVCAKKGCSKHWPVKKQAETGKTANKPAPKYDYEAENRKQQEARKRRDALLPHVFTAVAKTFVGTTFTDALLREAVAGNREDEIESAILAAGYRIGVDHAGAVIAFALAVNDASTWNLDGLVAFAKRHKVDFKAIQKQVDADQAAPSETPAKAKKGRK